MPSLLCKYIPLLYENDELNGNDLIDGRTLSFKSNIVYSRFVMHMIEEDVLVWREKDARVRHDYSDFDADG